MPSSFKTLVLHYRVVDSKHEHEAVHLVSCFPPKRYIIHTNSSRYVINITHPLKPEAVVLGVYVCMFIFGGWGVGVFIPLTSYRT